LDDRAWTQVVALTGHDLIQNVPQQTVNIVREDTRSDNSLVRQPTAGQNDRNIGQNPVTQTMTVNDFIDKQFCTVRYSSVDEAVRMVHILEPDVFLAKADVKSAFRLLQIWPGDLDQLGFTFDGKFILGFQLGIWNLF
jgi:FlaG/FlaF family flagellin (archaellin)